MESLYYTTFWHWLFALSIKSLESHPSCFVNCFNTICWTGHPHSSSTELLLYFSQRLVGHICVGLLLDPVDLCVCTSAHTTVLIRKPSYQAEWFPPLYSSLFKIFFCFLRLPVPFHINFIVSLFVSTEKFLLQF